MTARKLNPLVLILFLGQMLVPTFVAGRHALKYPAIIADHSTFQMQKIIGHIDRG